MKAGAWEEALTLFSEMYLNCKTSKSLCWKLLSEVSIFLPRSKQRLQPNTICYNSAVSACERSGRWDVALQLLFGMQVAEQTSYEDAGSYSAVLSG